MQGLSNTDFVTDQEKTEIICITVQKTDLLDTK